MCDSGEVHVERMMGSGRGREEEISMYVYCVHSNHGNKAILLS